MATYSSNDFRPGLKIMFEGEPYAIESSEFVKPGKGQAFARVKMRRLLTGSRVEKTFKSTDSAEGANRDRDRQFAQQQAQHHRPGAFGGDDRHRPERCGPLRAKDHAPELMEIAGR